MPLLKKKIDLKLYIVEIPVNKFKVRYNIWSWLAKTDLFIFKICDNTKTWF